MCDRGKGDNSKGKGCDSDDEDDKRKDVKCENGKGSGEERKGVIPPTWSHCKEGRSDTGHDTSEVPEDDPSARKDLQEKSEGAKVGKHEEVVQQLTRMKQLGMCSVYDPYGPPKTCTEESALAKTLNFGPRQASLAKNHGPSALIWATVCAAAGLFMLVNYVPIEGCRRRVPKD